MLKSTNTGVRMVVVAVLSCLVCQFAVAAIPNDADCKAAREKLAELTADDYKALKLKKLTNEQVGDSFLKYAENEESAAGKFVLLQDAFGQFVAGKVFEKADAVYSQVRGDQGVEVALAVVKPSLIKLGGFALGKNTTAKALKARIGDDDKSYQRVRLVKAQLKKNPGDESLCEQLGVEYVACGDWESALAAFATAPGEIAKVAEWEQNGGKGSDYTAEKAGAFWWKFADNFPKRKNVEEMMKLHAATWYKLALDKDAFKGNEKTIVEKRIAETEKFGAADEQVKGLVSMKMAKVDPIRLEYSRDCVVDMVGCPPGQFLMGDPKGKDPNDPMYGHQVQITRMFWISKFKVTHGLANKWKPIKLSPADELLGGWNAIHTFRYHEVEDFLLWLNKVSKFKRLAPKDYVFRLPTAAEWEYAYTANVVDEKDPYIVNKRYLGEVRNSDKAYREAREKITLAFPEVKSLDNTGDILPNDGYRLWTARAGSKQPNAWGIYDLVGLGGDWTMDRVCKDAFAYKPIEVDPLRWVEASAKSRAIVRGTWGRCGVNFWEAGWGTALADSTGVSCVHIVLGPDLMKEKGHDKKMPKKQ